MLTEGDSGEIEDTIVMEFVDQPCTVGLDVTSGCPLIVSNQYDSEQIVRGVQAVLRFRRTSPDGARDVSSIGGLPVQLTLLGDRGVSWRTCQVVTETPPSHIGD
jgi:hypothetical protein